MSEVILDTITGKSTATTITIGSTPVVSASANSMTIRGEGSAQTSIQQGLAKQWVSFDGTAGSVTPDDSFNTASLTDNGTGNFSANFTNAMANANFFSCGDANARRIVNSESRTTARHNIRVYEDSSASDRSGSRGAAIGDLA